jgi:hypothetical protein
MSHTEDINFYSHCHLYLKPHIASYADTHAHSHTRGQRPVPTGQDSPKYDHKIKTIETDVFWVVTPCSPVSGEPAASVFRLLQRGDSRFS